MNEKRKPQILIVSGPSGAGKSTLSKALIKNDSDTIIAVSHTTRRARPGEIDGKDYYFVNKQQFMKLVNDGEMLEYAEVYGNYYGTSQIAIQNSLTEGKNVILDIDWQGARKVKGIYPDAVSVYIIPPAEDETKKRLISRQQDSEEVIQARMSDYKEQKSHQHEYDHTIINDELPVATQQLARILHIG